MANTKINTNQLDDKVLTVDNLLSSDTVIISENPKEGGIDANTVACWHFDNTNVDVVSANTIAVSSYSSDDSYAKFGSAALVPTGSSASLNTPVQFGANSTIDFWVYFSDNSSSLTFNLKSGSYSELNFMNVSQTYGASFLGTLDNYVGDCGTGLHHFAFVIDTNLQLKAYIDGSFAGSADLTSRSQTWGLDMSDCYVESIVANNTIYIDELRISDIARWDSNFPVPTEPYHSDDDDPTTYSMHTAVDLSVFADKETDFKTPITSENLGATMSDLEEVKTSDLTFIGYISTTEPSPTDYNLKTGNLWYNSATLPSTLPISQSDLKVWDGSAWQNATADYNPDDLDAWKDIEDGETYVYFAGEWQDYAPQLSSQYFYLDTVTGKWEIKSDVNLPGHPTVSNAPTANMGIANKEYVDAIAGDFKRGLYDNGATVAYGSNTSILLADNTTVYTIALAGDITLGFDTTNLTIPTNAMTTFYLVLDMSNGVHNVIWPNTVQWGNVTPTMTTNACYMFSFTKPYNANIWIGNQMYSWEV